MEYYLAVKRNIFESVLMRWMNLEPIIQSDVSQKEKDWRSLQENWNYQRNISFKDGHNKGQKW